MTERLYYSQPELMHTLWKYFAGTGLALCVILFASAFIQEPGDPMSAVILSRMNVFYEGVENPIEVKVNGIAPGDVQVFISGGSMSFTETPGHYMVRVSPGKKAIINVGVKRGDSTHIFGTYEYRIKKVPDPVTYINAIRSDGVILKENLQTISGVFTRMENFDFDCAFQPQSYSMSVMEEGEWKEYKAIGPELTQEMKDALKKVEEEDKIIFHNVMTKGPAGDVRKVNSVVITVK